MSDANRMLVQFLPTHLFVIDDETRIEDREPQVKALEADFLQRLAEKPNENPIHTPLRAFEEGGKFIPLAGNNRLLAARRVGLQSVPCRVEPRPQTRGGMFCDQFRDNQLHRPYTAIEKANGITRLAELDGISHHEAGRRLGIPPAEVSKLIKVIGLPDDLLPLIGEGEGRVPFSVAYTVARLEDVTAIRELFDKAARGLLTRDAAEAAVKARLTGRAAKPQPVAFKNGHTKAETTSEDAEAVIASFTAFINAIRAAQKAGIQNPVRNAPQFLKTQP